MKQAIKYIRQQLQNIYPAEEVQALIYLLLEKKHNMSKLDICMGKDKIFSTEERKEWEDIVKRLHNEEPVQYILNEAEFCGLCFKVTPDTLIPRPETAELVNWIIQDYSHLAPSVLDIGSGSGCIAISISAALPNAKVESWDISAAALDIARFNNEKAGTSVTFNQQDILSNYLPQRELDILVSNPPYITNSEKAEMSNNVLQWEPSTALFVSDKDPLIFYRAIAEYGCQSLKEYGSLYFEINRAYGNETVRLLEDMGYKNIILRKDLSGNDRMIKATFIKAAKS